MEPMRIATWNVNSLNARLPKVLWWLERAKPDVLLMQETKLADDAVPSLPFREAGYALAHHGQGRWNGVAIASRCGIDGVIENFGKPLSRPAAPDVDDDEPLAEARMISAVCGGGCLRCLLLVMCTHPFAKEALTLHLARSEGHERYFGYNLVHRKVLASFHQHLMAEAPYNGPMRPNSPS